MRKLKLLILYFLLFSFAWGFAQDGNEILDRSDKTLFQVLGQWSMTISDYNGTALKTQSVFTCIAGSSERYLLVAEEPAVMRGIVLLRLKDTIYQYVRKIDRISQVAASQAFFNSTFSMEDVVSTKLIEFYNVVDSTESLYKGRSSYVLTLLAKNSKVAYNKIVCYIDKETYIPLEREYFAYSGTLIKRLLFNEQRNSKDGKLEYLSLTMYDTLRPKLKTEIVFENFDYIKKIEDYYFTVQYMKQVAR